MMLRPVSCAWYETVRIANDLIQTVPCKTRKTASPLCKRHFLLKILHFQSLPSATLTQKRKDFHKYELYEAFDQSYQRRLLNEKAYQLTMSSSSSSLLSKIMLSSLGGNLTMRPIRN